MTGTLKLLSSRRLLRSAGPLCWPCEPMIPLWGLPGCPSWGVGVVWRRTGRGGTLLEISSPLQGSPTLFICGWSHLLVIVTFLFPQISITGGLLYSFLTAWSFVASGEFAPVVLQLQHCWSIYLMAREMSNQYFAKYVYTKSIIWLLPDYFSQQSG